jgi:aspartate-semialdehyde dehydrogenase
VLVANGNCVAIPLVMTLAPLARVAAGARHARQLPVGLGRGLEAVDELGARDPRRPGRRTAPARATAGPLSPTTSSAHRPFDDEGWTGEERKIVQETRRMLDLPRLAVTPTAVRVPVRVGHSAAVVVVFDSRRGSRGRARGVAASRACASWTSPAPSAIPCRSRRRGLDDVLVARARRDRPTLQRSSLLLARQPAEGRGPERRADRRAARRVAAGAR